MALRAQLYLAYKPRMATKAPPTSSRERLLRVGARQARRAGVRSITVRGVCQQAEANLGSFVYHFGSREAFVAEVIERWYAPLLEQMSAMVSTARCRLKARLREPVLQFGDWAAADSRFITHVLMDAASGEAAAQRFVRSLADRHPALILRVAGRGPARPRVPRG